MIVNKNLNENLIDNNINNNKEKQSNSRETSNSNSENYLEISLSPNIGINKESINNVSVQSIEYNKFCENIKTNNLKSSFGNIIEDDIKQIDTVEFLDEKMRKTNKNKLIYNDGDDDLDSSKANRNSKEKAKNNFKYHININKQLLKYSTLITIVIYTIITIACCAVYHSRRHTDPFLFCFEFVERPHALSKNETIKDKIYFLTDLNSFYIIHIVFLLIFISISYMLIKGKQSQIDDFFKDMSIFFICTLLFNIPILFSGMFTHYFYGSYYQPLTYLILTFLSLSSMIKIFIVAKRHKYKNITNLVNVSILSSFMMAYQCYSFIFCLDYFYMNFNKPKTDDKKEYPAVEIVSACIYFSIGIIIMTVFKDIFFVIAMIILETGLLYSKRPNPYSLTITLVNIGIVSLNFASIILIIFHYNKKVFRLKEKK